MWSLSDNGNNKKPKNKAPTDRGLSTKILLCQVETTNATVEKVKRNTLTFTVSVLSLFVYKITFFFLLSTRQRRIVCGYVQNSFNVHTYTHPDTTFFILVPLSSFYDSFLLYYRMHALNKLLRRFLFCLPVSTQKQNKNKNIFGITTENHMCLVDGMTQRRVVLWNTGIIEIWNKPAEIFFQMRLLLWSGVKEIAFCVQNNRFNPFLLTSKCWLIPRITKVSEDLQLDGSTAFKQTLDCLTGPFEE